MDRSALRERLANMVAAASDGELAAGDALQPAASLTDLGLGSLGFLRLIDAVEAEYGIEVALDGTAPPDSVEALADQLERAGLPLAD
jgi:acyl carrier protein